MLTSWSEQSTPAELSSASVLIRPPARSNSTRPSDVTPRLPPSPITLARTWFPFTRTVVGAVTDVGVGLHLGLDVRADAAVEQQVRRRLQDTADQLRRRHLLDVVVDAEDRPDLRTDRDGFLLAAEDTAALADQRSVVVLPAGSGQLEQPLAFLPGAGGVGIGIEEDVAVIEGGEQPDVLGQQHAVAEHVAAHVADADDGEVLGLGVDTHLPEMAFDGLPRALGGDAHHLVVVAHRAARRERVAQPESVGLRDSVGDVGEGGGALVGGHDEVGIVAVATHHIRRGDDGPGGHVDVVGDVEQPGDEQLVAGDALGASASRSAAASPVATGGCLTTNPPLAPTGTMTAFLTACALTRPRISVRKSSRRSDQRRPPRATNPNRRCTPSTRGEYTKISNFGRGSGSSSISPRIRA